MASSVLQFRSSPVLILSMFLLFLCCFCSSVVGLGDGNVGGKTEMKDAKTNKKVQELGKFAVEEFNRKNNGSSLTFSEVVKGQQQVVKGVKYYLTISAKLNGIEKFFYAVVLVHLPVEHKPIELISFVPLLQGGNVGGKTEIKDVKTNKEVQKLGKFAVEEFNRKYNICGPLTFSEVVEAQKQVVAGVNYYLKISAKQNGIEKLFDAVVWVHLPVEHKPIQLMSFVPSTN